MRKALRVEKQTEPYQYKVRIAAGTTSRYTPPTAIRHGH